MSGQLWSVPEEGGYLYSDQLSETLRMEVQPLCKFRQFCDAEDGTQKGVGAGESFSWNVVEQLPDTDDELSESDPMHESSFRLVQRTMTVTEFGNSVPFTGKLKTLGKQDVVLIIDKALKHRCRKMMDSLAYEQFNRTPIRVAPTSGTSTTAVTVTTNSATATTNNVEMRKDHIKAISDNMKESDVPPYMDDCYFSISHPSTFRTMKNDLEGVYQYTDKGLMHIMNGEVGKYEDVRFVEQNYVPKGGANDSTTFNARTATADAWNNGKSSWAFFMGADTVTEAIVIPEEIRARIAGDYGRARGIAYYYLGKDNCPFVAKAANDNAVNSGKLRAA